TKRPYIAINATNSNEHSQNPASNTAQSENKDGQVATALPSNTDIAATTIPQDSTLTGKSLEDAVAQQEEDENEEDADAIPFKKWNASSVIAPIYSSTMGGSSIDQEFADNNKAAGLNLSYGVNVGYNLSPRLSVRTGVHKVNLSYTTNDIVYGVTVQPGDVQLLSVNSYDRNAVSNPGAVSTADLGSSFSQEFLSDNTFTGFQGEISQRLGYLEVPLELKYKLLDRKLSVNVMGGLSALFLTDNSIAVTNNTSKLELGEDDNFNSFNHSANFGLGIDYLFTDQLGITVEPMFKYQLNALKENTADFKPFNVGIYSGITYRF
ncbi:outer membrane beta-barrel protein, partial [Nonlabens ulvanivorans]